MYLKGGTLMAIAHHSGRVTGDVDYSWFGEPFATGIADDIRKSLDEGLIRAAAQLGYVDLVCRVQTAKRKPHGWKDGKPISYAALNLTIGYARRGTPQEEALRQGKANPVIRVEISFNEEVKNQQQLLLDDSATCILAYAPVEIIAEKLRALLQQTQRRNPHYRRQDVYDIHFLLEMFAFDDDEKWRILETFAAKARTRGVVFDRYSLADEAVRAAAEKEWHTLQQEIDQPLSPFAESYAVVRDFYESLPWHKL